MRTLKSMGFCVRGRPLCTFYYLWKPYLLFVEALHVNNTVGKRAQKDGPMVPVVKIANDTLTLSAIIEECLIAS